MRLITARGTCCSNQGDRDTIDFAWTYRNMMKLYVHMHHAFTLDDLLKHELDDMSDIILNVYI